MPGVISKSKVNWTKIISSEDSDLEPKYSQSQSMFLLTAKVFSARNSIYSRENWRALQDSNLRPQDLSASATLFHCVK